CCRRCAPARSAAAASRTRSTRSPAPRWTAARRSPRGLTAARGQSRAPARGQTRTWAERAPRDAPDQALEAARILDARQAELGRQLAARPPEWALRAWGVP